VTTQIPHPGPAANLADLLRAAAATAGERPALIGAHGERTWAQLDAAADRGAATLAGHPAGERVVLGLPTGPDLAAALFAVLRAGLVAVPVDPRRTDLAWVVRRVGAVAAITDEAVAGAAPVLGSAQLATWWQGAAPAPTPARAGGEDLAMLARAARAHPPVMLSHRAFLAAAAALRAAPRLDVTPTDRILQMLPLFHVVGLVTAFLPAALAGAAVVIPEKPDTSAGTVAQAALAAVRAHRVSILPAEPTLYRQLDRIPGYERALATVRLMTSGSSPLDPDDFVKIRTSTGQAVREGYGISESAAAVTSTLMTETAHPGSVGLPYPGVEVRIGDDHGGDESPSGDEVLEPTVEPGTGSTDTEQDSGLDAGGPHDIEQDGIERDDIERAGEHAVAGEVAEREVAAPDTSGLVLSDDDDDLLEWADVPEQGEVGPIVIRGDTLFSGYWPDGAGGPGPDGWYATGDIGYLDDAGELHLVDRAAETVTVAGFTVYPREVEDILVTHPYVADAAVVGVPGRAGPTVVAALVPQPGTRPTVEDLDDFLADRLPPFKRPTDFQLVEVLPRTEVGRLDRQTVRQNFARYRGIALDGPAQLRSATGQPDDPAESGEPPASLNRLGRKLPADGNRSRRGAEDTDDDLF